MMIPTLKPSLLTLHFRFRHSSQAIFVSFRVFLEHTDFSTALCIAGDMLGEAAVAPTEDANVVPFWLD